MSYFLNARQADTNATSMAMEKKPNCLVESAIAGKNLSHIKVDTGTRITLSTIR